MRVETDLRPLMRFFETLPTSGDLEFGVLKCHLLIEDVLTLFIERSVNQPAYIRKARLTFAQKLQIAQAVVQVPVDVWVWKSLKLLNEARNELGHGLDSAEINKKIEAFNAHVKMHEDHFQFGEDTVKFKQFHYAALAVYSRIAIASNIDMSSIRIPTILERVAAVESEGKMVEKQSR